jgi:hypothetical protein
MVRREALGKIQDDEPSRAITDAYTSAVIEVPD